MRSAGLSLFTVDSIRRRIESFTPCSIGIQGLTFVTLNETLPQSDCSSPVASEIVYCRTRNAVVNLTFVSAAFAGHLTTMIIDVNDIVAISVADRLQVSVLAIVNDEHFLLEERQHGSFFDRVGIGLKEIIRQSQIYMRLNRLRASWSVPRLRTLPQLYDKVVLIQTNNFATERTIGTSAGHLKLFLTPPCMPCVDGHNETGEGPAVLVECTFPYASPISRVEERTLLWAAALVHQTESFHLIMGNHSSFRDTPLPPHTIFEDTSLLDASVRNNVKILIRRCQQRFPPKVETAIEFSPIVLCIDPDIFTLGSFASRLSETLIMFRNVTCLSHSSSDGLLSVVDLVHSIEGKNGSSQTKNRHKLLKSDVTKVPLSPHQSDTDLESIWVLVLVAVFLSSLYVERYPGYVRHPMLQHRDLSLQLIFDEFLIQVRQMHEAFLSFGRWLSETIATANQFAETFWAHDRTPKVDERSDAKPRQRNYSKKRGHTVAKKRQ